MPCLNLKRIFVLVLGWLTASIGHAQSTQQAGKLPVDCASNVSLISIATTSDENTRNDYTAYKCADGWHFNILSCGTVYIKHQKNQDVACVRIKDQENCCPGIPEDLTCPSDNPKDTVHKSTSFKCGNAHDPKHPDSQALWVVGNGNIQMKISGYVDQSGKPSDKGAHMDIEEQDMNTAGDGVDNNGNLPLDEKLSQSQFSGKECDNQPHAQLGNNCKITDLRRRDFSVKSDSGGLFQGITETPKGGGQEKPVVPDNSGAVPTSR